MEVSWRHSLVVRSPHFPCTPTSHPLSQMKIFIMHFTDEGDRGEKGAAGVPSPICPICPPCPGHCAPLLFVFICSPPTPIFFLFLLEQPSRFRGEAYPARLGVQVGVLGEGTGPPHCHHPPWATTHCVISATTHPYPLFFLSLGYL